MFGLENSLKWLPCPRVVKSHHMSSETLIYRTCFKLLYSVSGFVIHRIPILFPFLFYFLLFSSFFFFLSRSSFHDNKVECHAEFHLSCLTSYGVLIPLKYGWHDCHTDAWFHPVGCWELTLRGWPSEFWKQLVDATNGGCHNCTQVKPMEPSCEVVGQIERPQNLPCDKLVM